jgi:hypothetical protein
MTTIVRFDDKEKTDVTRYEEKDPFIVYGEAIKTKNIIVGSILLFSKGDFLVNKAPVEIGDTEFIANLDWMTTGWIHWKKKKPIAHVMVRIGSGAKPCKRAALGDTDDAKWETDNRGNPVKPWQYSTYMPLVARSGEVYTFVTSSRGGIDATGELGLRYGEHRKNNPDVFPLIKLIAASYPHPDFGKIHIPKFVPAGYLPKAKFYEALKEAGVDASAPPDVIDTRDDNDDGLTIDVSPQPQLSKPAGGKAPLPEELDDEIPFS